MKCSYKKLRKNIIEGVFLISMVTLSITTMQGQYYQPGEESIRIKWEQLKGDDLSIIYPTNLNREGARETAKFYYNTIKNLNLIYGNSNYSAPFSKQFPLVIHPYNANSNGVTLWSPRQIHLLTLTNDAISYPQDWNMQLALHEWRHAWQISHFNKGFWKILSYIFGEEVIGLAGGIYPSSWFLEGDAVVAETEVLGVGRGTNANFLSTTLDAIIPNNYSDPNNFAYKKNRSWDRWRFGSLKYYSPNRYEVGYMINAMARYESGDYFLSDKILNKERRGILNANIVANAFEKYSGHTHREYTQDSLLQKFYYLNTPVDFIEKMKGEKINLKRINTSKSEKVSGAERGYYTEYDYIIELSKDTLLATVGSYGYATHLLMITRNNGEWKDEILRPMGSIGLGISSYKGEELIWTESVTDPRWGQIARSKLFSYNIRNKELKDLTPTLNKSLSFYAPSKSGDTLYAVAYSPLESTSQIYAVRNLLTNSELSDKILDLGLDCQITALSIDDKNLFFLGLEKGASENMYLYKLENFRKNDKPIRLLGFGNHLVKNMTTANNKVYFVTDYFGKEMICSVSSNANSLLTPDDMRIESSLTNVRDYDVSGCDDKLYIVHKDNDRGQFIYEQDSQDIEIKISDWEFDYPLAKELHRQSIQAQKEIADNKANENSAISNIQDYKIERYSKGGHLFNFYSWKPFYMNINSVTAGSYDSFVDESNLGFTLMSQNTLGTATTMLGYSYNLHAHRSAGHAKFTYSGFYPIFEGEIHVGDKGIIGNKTSVRSYVQSYIPFNLSKNGWSKGVTPLIYWHYKNYDYVLDNMGQNAMGEIVYKVRLKDRHLLLASLSGYSVKHTQRANYFPKIGIGGRVYAGFSPNSGGYFGNIYAAYSYGYLPGLAFNQGLRVSAAYQKQNVKSYFLDNLIAEPRGYTEDIYAKNYLRFTADYAIPIYLGDISLGAFAYLQSVNIVPFYDLGLYKNDQWKNRSSFGADITFRTHLFRIGFPLSIGVRYARTSAPCDISSYSKAYYKEKNIGDGKKNYASLIMEISF